mmetsp:Transcript_31164/g.89941  ORF Transcript_31164/g.89941 Transcript_31164/m.89941 type:complete len:265 (-) Transcript_31164:38-832(-)
MQRQGSLSPTGCLARSRLMLCPPAAGGGPGSGGAGGRGSRGEEPDGGLDRVRRVDVQSLQHQGQGLEGMPDEILVAEDGHLQGLAEPPLEVPAPALQKGTKGHERGVVAGRDPPQKALPSCVVVHGVPDQQDGALDRRGVLVRVRWVPLEEREVRLHDLLLQIPRQVDEPAPLQEAAATRRCGYPYETRVIPEDGLCRQPRRHLKQGAHPGVAAARHRREVDMLLGQGPTDGAALDRAVRLPRVTSHSPDAHPCAAFIPVPAGD